MRKILPVLAAVVLAAGCLAKQYDRKQYKGDVPDYGAVRLDVIRGEDDGVAYWVGVRSAGGKFNMENTDGRPGFDSALIFPGNGLNSYRVFAGHREFEERKRVAQAALDAVEKPEFEVER